jgi:hypothetical protein
MCEDSVTLFVVNCLVIKSMWMVSLLDFCRTRLKIITAFLMCCASSPSYTIKQQGFSLNITTNSASSNMNTLAFSKK